MPTKTNALHCHKKPVPHLPVPHLHVEGQKDHLDPTTPIPGEDPQSCESVTTTSLNTFTMPCS